MFENVISLRSARCVEDAPTLDTGYPHASGAPWANDLVRSRSFAKAVHDSVRDASLGGRLHCFLPGLAAWHALVRRHISTRECASPVPYIWEIALCEFPGFADAFQLWAVEHAIASPFGPRASDAAEAIVFSTVEDAALPGAVGLAVAEVLRHSPDPDSPLPEWERRAVNARIAAIRRLTTQTASVAAAVDRAALLDCLVCAEQEALRREEDASGGDRTQARRFRRLATRYLTMRYRITGGPTALDRIIEAAPRYL